MNGFELGSLIVGVVLALVELWGVAFDVLSPETINILTGCVIASIVVSVIAGRLKKRKENKAKGISKSKSKSKSKKK